MQFAKRHGFIDGTGDTADFVAARGKYIFQKISDHQLVFRYENPEHLNASPRICPCRFDSCRPHQNVVAKCRAFQDFPGQTR